MNEVVERLVIALGLDSKELKKGLGDATKTVDSGLKKIAGAFSAAFVAAKIGQAMQEFTQDLSELNRLAKSVNMSVEAIEDWRGAAREFGADAENFGQVFQGLNDSMEQAVLKNRGVLKKMVDNGILPELKDANGQAKDTQEYLLEIADTLQGMDTRTATAILKDITGVTDIDTVEFLQQGSAAIRDQMKATQGLAKFTSEDAKAAKELEKAQNKMSQALKMTFLPVFRALAPIMTKVADAFTWLGRNIRILYPVIAALAAVIAGPLIASLLGMAAAFLASPIGIITVALVALGYVIDDLIKWLEGGESALGDFFEELFGSKEAAQEALDNIVAMVITLRDAFVEVGQVLWSILKPIIQAVFGFVVENIVDTIQFIAGLKDAFIAMVNTGIELWKAFAAILSGDFDAAIEHIKNAFNGFIELLKSGIEWALGKLGELASKIPGLNWVMGKLGYGGNAGAAVPVGATNNNNSEVNVENNMTFNGPVGASEYKQLEENYGRMNSADYTATANGAYGN